MKNFKIEIEFGTDTSGGYTDTVWFTKTSGGDDIHSPHIYRLADLGFSLDTVSVQVSTLTGITGTDLDGLKTTVSNRPPAADPVPHPNGVTSIDHVVAITPVLDRTIAALQHAGLDLRRVRDEPSATGAPRQAFFRLGEGHGGCREQEGCEQDPTTGEPTRRDLREGAAEERPKGTQHPRSHGTPPIEWFRLVVRQKS